MTPPEPTRAPKLARLATGDRADSPSRRLVTLVRDALLHLHDLPYLETHSLGGSIPSDQVARAHGPGGALRRSLSEAIEALRPPTDASPHSHAWRTYELLRERYLESRLAVDVQARLGISKSEYHRDHRAALEGVAVLLRARWGFGPDGAVVEGPSAPGGLRVATASEREWDLGDGGNGRRRHNLPGARTTFVGREREAAEVRSLLGTSRLLTLTGTGGCGKTRLAVEAGRSLLDAYYDGVWLVELAPLADPLLLAQTVAFTFGVQEQAGQGAVSALKTYLHARHLLLVLDNCEHLVGACAELSDALLNACPRLTILATSRQPLGVQGETTLRVPSLSSPPAEEARSREAVLQVVLSHDASRLFLDRARSALPSFAPSESNVSAIGEICRRLDGIPLAIELAAARVRVLSPDQIASRLDHDFHLLTSGSRTALPRQQTLKASVDWSHDLLPEEERVLLRRLPVFAGGFSLEAAEAVCAGGGIEELEVVNLLAQLVEKSLVEAETGEGDTRYRLLEPVRQYSWHRLEESGELASARDRHLDWRLALGRQAEAELRGPEQRRWLDRLDQEHGNLRAALGWSLETRVEAGLELTGRLHVFWMFRCYFREGYRWLTEFLGRTPEGVARRARAVALRGAGNLANYAVSEGEWTARRLLEQSLAIWRELGDRWRVAWVLADIGDTAREQGDADLALALIEEGERIARELGDEYLIGIALWQKGLSARLGGDRTLARTVLEEAQPLLLEAGSPHTIAHGKLALGATTVLDGDRARARVLLEESLASLREERQTIAVGFALGMLALLAIVEGEYSQAWSLLEECVALGHDLDWWADHLPYPVYLAGVLECRRGALERGARLLGAADSAIRGLSAPYHATARPGYPELGEAAVEAARTALGEEAFARAWAEGQAMSLDQAVEYALADEGERPSPSEG